WRVPRAVGPPSPGMGRHPPGPASHHRRRPRGPLRRSRRMNDLVDTNILTRLAEPGHAMHQPALDAVKLLVRQGHRLHIVPQNLYEFWGVCTRPTAVNGLGETAAEAAAELANLK